MSKVEFDLDNETGKEFDDALRESEAKDQGDSPDEEIQETDEPQEKVTKKRGRPKTADRLNEFLGTVQSQASQIGQLAGTIESLKAQIEDMRKPKEQPQEREFEPPTLEDWSKDPTSATERISKYSAQIATRQTEERLRKEYEAKFEAMKVDTDKQRAIAQAVQTYPELQDQNSEFSRLANQIYAEQDLSKVKMGPVFAANMANNILLMRRASQEQPSPAQQTFATPATDYSRDQRMRQAQMIPSGHSTRPTNEPAKLSQDQINMAKKLGVSLDSYLDSAKSLGLFGEG